MRNLDGKILFAAHDLDRFLACSHATFLDIRNLQEPLPKSGEDAQLRLVREKGFEHEKVWLDAQKQKGISIAEIPEQAPLHERVRATREAMNSGVDIIYQAALISGNWHGYADFLRRTEVPGVKRPRYEVLDTKLSRTAKPEHISQLCIYTDLLAQAQGFTPNFMHLVLGDRREVSFRFADFVHYFRVARGRFEAFSASPPADSYPEPCRACERCCWHDLCTAQWENDNHLSLVANIQRPQIEKLRAAGVRTVRALAELPQDSVIPKLSTEIFARLRSQARLTTQKSDTGENKVEILPAREGRGFARLPKPDPADLFLDFEGDPLYPDGIEYLMGLYFVDSGTPVFKPFWGHDHDAERKAFEQLMGFLEDRLHRNPNAHIYHYNHYEETAIKRLASTYGTRENAVDDMLRGSKLVDLYKVVREGIRVSEPRYSLKNLEVFYMEHRGGEVKTAGESIVFYEKWRETGDSALLQQIADYNEADCRSTALLRDWLLTLRPPDIPWAASDESSDESRAKVRQDAELRYSTYAQSLLKNSDGKKLRVCSLTAQLLEFHRREAKPQWWAMFDRKGRSEDELIDDAECLGGMRMDRDIKPFPEKRSVVFTYRFPPQDYKFQVGDNCLLSDTLEPAGTIFSLNADDKIVQIKRSMKRERLPICLSIIPAGPIDSKVLRDAMCRYADNMIAGTGRYKAVQSLLNRDMPEIGEHAAGVPIIRNSNNLLKETIQAVGNMLGSYLFVQGPPGSGKTYTSSHVIVELMRAGKKVGVAANSHKAINNLLTKIEKRAEEIGFKFRGIKKSTEAEDTLFKGRFIWDATDNKEVDSNANLIAGTAWLFARQELDQELDYLFIDEAGQVSLANLVAMGLSAKNIVLVGDQMQLAQPIQGVHPGESGLSVLDYLLQDAATIAPEKGIFLPTTWRMHEDVCRFISDVVYDGRLHPEQKNQSRRLILIAGAHPALASTGIRFIPVEHAGCSQKSEEEGRVIRDLFESLMCQSYSDREGREHPFRMENILVVAPYNVQVNYLKSILPDGALVGTVDKFQGQEAEVVLISMTTSGAEDMPRNIEFLYSKNRLNVAISRARCLAIVVANRRLLEIPCRTVEQMQLVNTLCRAATLQV
jgi:predicted RecB family nuclease